MSLSHGVTAKRVCTTVRRFVAGTEAGHCIRLISGEFRILCEQMNRAADFALKNLDLHVDRGRSYHRQRFSSPTSPHETSFSSAYSVVGSTDALRRRSRSGYAECLAAQPDLQHAGGGAKFWRGRPDRQFGDLGAAAGEALRTGCTGSLPADSAMRRTRTSLSPVGACCRKHVMRSARANSGVGVFAPRL